MAGRGPQSFKKRQKEQERKDHQQAKFEKKLQRRRESRDNAGNPGGHAEGGSVASERPEPAN
jgi:hypothetical protein